MMRKNVMRSLEYLHVLLIVSMFAPLIYVINRQMEAGQIYRMYFASYLLIVPVIGFIKVGKRCKNFIQFLLVFLCMCFFVKIGAEQLGSLLLNEKAASVYIICMLVCTGLIAIAVIVTRMYRIRRKEAREKKDITWMEDGFQIDRPKNWVVAVFVVIYVIGMFRSCPQICNLALYSSLLYLLVAIAYEYINAIEQYLKLNRNTYQVKNIPSIRIYEIRRFYLVGYFVLLSLTLIPAIMTVDNRKYIDIQTEEYEVELTAEDIYIQAPSEGTSDPKIVPVEPFIVIPRVVEILLGVSMYLVTGIIVARVLFTIVSSVRRKMVEFASESEEEEDTIDLSESFKDDEEILNIEKKRKKDSVKFS